MKYIYIIAKQLLYLNIAINKSFPQQKLAIFQEKDKKDKLTSIIFLTPIFSIRVDGVWSTNPDTGPPIALDVVSLLSLDPESLESASKSKTCTHCKLVDAIFQKMTLKKNFFSYRDHTTRSLFSYDVISITKTGRNREAPVELAILKKNGEDSKSTAKSWSAKKRLFQCVMEGY